MSTSNRFGEIRLTTGSQLQGAATPSSDQPFRILLMGDFSGRASRGLQQLKDLGQRKAVAIDRDSFDEVLQRLHVSAQIPLPADPNTAVELSFTELDDFGPDAIFEKAPLFASLRKLRNRLANNDTFATAAEEVKQWQGVKAKQKQQAATVEAEAPTAAANERAEAGADLLSAALRATPTATRSGGTRAADWDALVQQIVEPYVLPGKDPRQDEFLAIVDRAISDSMRALIHQPEFKQLEASWRSIYYLTRNVETTSSLRIFLLDISQQELRADLTMSASPAEAGIYKNLVEQTVGTSGGQPWAAIVGDYQFAPSEADIGLLARLAIVAVAAGAPLLTAAHYTFVSTKPIGGLGDPDDWAAPSNFPADLWQELRDLPESAYLCLTFPSVMLRLPYGKQTRSAERFAFEEVSSPPQHQELLWSNGAYLVALHLAESFQKAGWEMQPPPVRQVSNLPLFVYRDASESEAYPCAEAFLVDRAADRIRMQGLTPLRSLKNSDAVQIAGMRAISTEMAELRGRWS